MNSPQHGFMRTNQKCAKKTLPALILLLMVTLCLTIKAQDFTFRKSQYVKDTTGLAEGKRFYDLARSAYNNRKDQQAVEYYLKSIEEYGSVYNSALELDDYSLAVNALLEKADVERRIYNNDIPSNTLEEALKILKDHIDPSSFLWFRTYLAYGKAAHSKADYYRGTDFLDSAQALYNRSVQYDSTLYDDLIEYKFYGYLYSNKSIDTLRKYMSVRLEREYEKQEANERPEDILYILQDYPNIYDQNGESDIALAYAISNYKYFIENREFIKGPDRYGEVYFDLSLALYRKGHYEKANEIAFEYLDSKESMVNDSFKATLLSMIGVSYSDLGEHKKSIEYFNRFLEMPSSSFLNGKQHEIARATAFLNLGINLRELGEPERALEHYQRALEQMRLLVEFPSTDLTNCYRYIGDFYAVEQLWNNALVSYDSALRNTELNYSAELLEFPEMDSTSRFSLEALTILKKKASALYHNSDLDPTRYLESVINHVDKTHEKITANRESLYKSDGKLFLSQFFKDLYETGIEACYQLFQLTGNDKYARKAFGYAQKSKSNLFLEQEKGYKEFASSSIPYSLKEEYYEANDRLGKLKGLLYNALNNSVTGDSVLRMSNQIIVLEERVSTLRDSISMSQNAYKNIDQSDLAVNVIDRGAYLIEYFYGDQNVYVFGLSSNLEISFSRTSNNDLFKENLEGFLKIISVPPDIETFDNDLEVFRASGLSLYEQLVKPVIDYFGSSPEELIIVPDEFLTRVPFEAFLTKSNPDSNFRNFDYLLNECKVRYLISSELMRNENHPVSGKSKRILGIGFSESDSNTSSNRRVFSSLPGTEREIQYLNASFDGDYYLGVDGSKKRFLEEARNYDILHLAIHGKADSTSRFQSSLIFNGSDSILNPNQLYLANIKARLTVLSACESGKGQIESGEGTFSIARGFATVGVPNVIMSLWEVNDRTTSTQMVDFYNNLLNEGHDLNSSLRKVKLDYIAKGDSYLSHPYFWASFIHLGQNTSFETNNSRTIVLLYISAALVLTLLILVYIKKKRSLK